ncbi:MAG: Asp23/Gls24 family envelope stress response protein [Actinoallomurus sp.]
MARAVEGVRERIGIGHKRGDQGVKAQINGREVSIEVTIVIEYGYVVMDVARQVKTNVAIQTNRMLGLRVVEVNVIVDDVRMPTAPRPPEPPSDDQRLTIGD